ncbi:SulP family inorganic anion transporter [Microbacterium sp. SA39]|uniref:SulP family inorganic anion transporter n=1 Tax=Microbacterium sp. SA39 TaxID=1263625 RepID=UPI00061E0F24|nr:SulP family inorganic anion transporter [Microbacterium sp. SA39]KJQ53193.1 putative sulfate transporter [Microbacterium sp. SA39]
MRERWLRYRRRFGSRRTIVKDLRAGIVLGVESVPDGLAAGLLAGVNPLYGLNAYIVGTLFGAVATGSVFMTVQATGAMAVIVADVPEIRGPQAAGAMATMTIMAGIAMLALGLAGLGRLVRFIPAAVLIGFVNAVAVNIVLSQLENLTGFASASGNRLTRAVDTLLHLGQVSWLSVLVGAVTVLLILVLERTRIGALSMVVGIVVGSCLVLLLPEGSVSTISDVAEVERSIPQLSLPDFSLILALLVPALSLALVGLVQGAAISGSIPNPDGRYPNASADFRGQGIANIATGLLQGMPVGGSMSATALSRAAGARSASANLIAGIVMVLIVLLFAPLIGYIAMPALAGLLIIIGVRTFKPEQIVMVLKTGSVQIAVFLVTFALTLIIPLQYAVLTGVGLAVILHIARQSNRVRVKRWVFEPGGGLPWETAPPARLGAGETVILTPYGSLFFASADSFRQQLPTPDADASDAFVIVRLRGTDELGVTFLTMLRTYAKELRAAGATLMVAGVGPRVSAQLSATGVREILGEENVFVERPRLGDATLDAVAEAARRTTGED